MFETENGCYVQPGLRLADFCVRNSDKEVDLDWIVGLVWDTMPTNFPKTSIVAVYRQPNGNVVGEILFNPFSLKSFHTRLKNGIINTSGISFHIIKNEHLYPVSGLGNFIPQRNPGHGYL